MIPFKLVHNRLARVTWLSITCWSTASCEPRATAHPEGLGAVDFETSCSAAVDTSFNRAVALLHHMTYPEARRAFQEVADADSACAMAHWGIAMTLFQPLWPTRPGREDLEAGWTRIQEAERLGAKTVREEKFIAMAAAFFDSAGGDYWTRIHRWETAARHLFDSFPADIEAAAFYSLAHLATAPPAGGTEHQDSVAKILAGILAKQPTHPGAVHYLIHANDATGRERESLDVVRQYVEIAPHNPHALHMPTHIFVRLGDWPDVIAGNTQAADAALEHPAGAQSQWVWDEFPHALEYLVYAALQRGDDSTAYEAMVRLQSTPSLEPSFKTAFHLSSIPARYALERQAWAEAAQLQPRPGDGLPWDRFPWPEAITWYARGLGAVRSGNNAGAVSAEQRLAALRGVAEQAGEDLFARNIEILRLQVSAWLARANGSVSDAVAQMRAAVMLEAQTPKHAVTPAPTLPASEVLGDLLMELGRPAEALEAYRASLQPSPGRLNSLAGAARAALAAGDSAAANAWSAQIRAQVVAGSPRSTVQFIVGRRSQQRDSV